jgi:DNA-binding HxlR family transcriptional regulator
VSRRSYDQYCPIARALDAVGDRWSLLIVRELMGGPRRYTDLHTDLPGVSTDILASRLKDLERDDVVARRTLPAPAAARVYELTARGRGLLPVLTALSDWGAGDLGEMRVVDSSRAHWFAVPLLRALRGVDFGDLAGEIDVRLPEGGFHIRVAEGELLHADGPAAVPAAVLTVSADARLAISRSEAGVADCVERGTVTLTGSERFVQALRKTPANVEG